MDDVVESVLQAASQKELSFKPITVNKIIDVDIDVGNMLLSDINKPNSVQLRSQCDEYLKDLARDNTQLLLNRIWELPVERIQDAVIAQLPEGKTRIPREKPVPAPKPPTKWQQYAKAKSIQKRKKGRMAWDEQTKEWRPRWGYKRAVEGTDDWLIEVPTNADPYEDQFEKKRKAKKENIAKNELQRMRNISRNMKGKLPPAGLTPAERNGKTELSRSLAVAHKSTASLGKFTAQLANEKPAKNLGKRRKFDMNTGNSQAEKERALNAFNSLHKNTPVIDKTRAANDSMRHEQEARRVQNSGGGAKKTGFKGAKRGKTAKSNNRGNRKQSMKAKQKMGKKMTGKKR